MHERKHSTPSFGSATLNFPQNLPTIHRGYVKLFMSLQQ